MPPLRTTSDDALTLRAFHVLESREQLVWHANARNESIPQTTLYFEKLLHGLEGVPVRPLYTEAVYGERLPGCFGLKGREGKGKGKMREGGGKAGVGGDVLGATAGATAGVVEGRSGAVDKAVREPAIKREGSETGERG